MQNEAAVFRQRASQHHRFIQTDLWIARLRDNFELLKDPFHLQIFQRLIDNNAHGTLVVVLADIDYRAAENGVLKRGHGNQKVML